MEPVGLVPFGVRPGKPIFASRLPIHPSICSSAFCGNLIASATDWFRERPARGCAQFHFFRPLPLPNRRSKKKILRNPISQLTPSLNFFPLSCSLCDRRSSRFIEILFVLFDDHLLLFANLYYYVLVYSDFRIPHRVTNMKPPRLAAPASPSFANSLVSS